MNWVNLLIGKEVCRVFRLFAIPFILLSLPLSGAFAVHETWNQIVDEMESIIDESYEKYLMGNLQEAKDTIDRAYFGYYEKLGFEKTVMAYISGSRATRVEYQFSIVKKNMTLGKSEKEIKSDLDTLITYLRQDADQLDGKEESAGAVFFASLLIIVREGFEAILVIGAIISYLLRSGNKKKIKVVHIGSIVALGVSVIMAFALSFLWGISGEYQEVAEGITILTAVVVLFYISNWMIAETEANSWNRYIEKKLEGSLTQNSLFSLAFISFLVVFREGAETILFYQALLVNTEIYYNMIWIGIGVGCGILVLIYLLIRFLSVRIPLKPFFYSTSLLLSIMAVSFLGAGIKELQEGNVISVTPISWIGSVDLLGVYPTLETLTPQIILLLVTIITFAIHLKRVKKS